MKNKIENKEYDGDWWQPSNWSHYFVQKSIKVKLSKTISQDILYFMSKYCNFQAL